MVRRCSRPSGSLPILHHRCVDRGRSVFGRPEAATATSRAELRLTPPVTEARRVHLRDPRTGARVLSMILACVAVTVGCGGAEEPIDRPQDAPNVVLITIDTLRTRERGLIPSHPCLSWCRAIGHPAENRASTSWPRGVFGLGTSEPYGRYSVAMQDRTLYARLLGIEDPPL